MLTAQPLMASASQLRQGSTMRPVASTSARVPVVARRSLVVRASQADADAELEARLEKLRASKGATPYGQGKKSERREEGAGAKASSSSSSSTATKPVYDYTGETLHYEGGPHKGDLAVNLALGTTLVWLPLTLAAIGRAAFVNYRFTDRRFSVKTTAPWKNEQTDVAYQEVKEVVTVGRGVGLWGDMVVTLNNGDKVELRSLDKFLELKKYILERRDALAPPKPAGASAASVTSRPKGAALTAAELMGEPEPTKKGF
uniref:YdbS-like PH domain-containing protein n=1 Tax=Chlamydomonas leiostraca TaxID=1034604 RepID=A0A7S0R2K7_9CHLO|mmetsp:Transcript_12357/g.30302  ORF Transcript_12357/g.30302 Transcript_12357/m.30302 type:complete len:258 (+) Transcript_12357:60-833(+)|eukprot:CAMPEP_0202865144 /NCGR_PEP_ID=MMETSP1391-20130828/5300_1 /ASSEMBLY_ACC=CAM_ASM_000867 /TAXON_ID=1034604 /ORGANISM="Chlamydomonas leiostraca, Strain SAG 11-49" /LENGTH=257 /DNA_ID=CAMNT_0049544947 /DNA_START=57 /DNA_END=830 /DNA_ORIENTATION=-